MSPTGDLRQRPVRVGVAAGLGGALTLYGPINQGGPRLAANPIADVGAVWLSD